jgi:hypothetical protein
LLRRISPFVLAAVLVLAVPAVALAAGSTDTGKPTGHDWTLDSIFAIALGLPLLLGLLTLIDIARGKHTERQHDH